MDPNNYEQPGFRLPEPNSASESAPARPEKVISVSPEVLLGQKQPGPVLNPQASPLVPSAGQPPTNQQSTISNATDTPIMADDTDLIEKEWVIKAKAIVERTKNDPHQQNTEISNIKADYLKKRYNKDIKVISSES